MVQARPHDRVQLDLSALTLDEDEVRALPWARERVARIRRIGGILELEIGSYAGELWVDDRTCIEVVELRPGTVAACLRLSTTGRRMAAQQISGSGRLPPTAAVASLYAETLVETLAGGTHKEYVARTVTTDRPRGRIDVVASARGPWSRGRVDRVVARYRNLSEDNALNRALLAACVQAEWRLTGRANDLVRIRTAMQMLGGATLDRRATVPIDAATPNRYHPSVALARDLLRGVATVSAQRTDPGRHSAWISVERVFEEAIRSLFADLFDGQVTRGEDEDIAIFTALEAEPPPMAKTANPDVVLRRKDGATFIVDAKYRRTGEYPSDEQLYQLLAHATACQAKAAAIVTPALHGEPTIRRLGRDSSGCSVDVVSVDSASASQMRTMIGTWLDSLPAVAR